MTDAKRQNPLLSGEYGTPHNTAPFDQITLADYEEAIMEGMRQEEAAIKEITENPEEPTCRLLTNCSTAPPPYSSIC